MGVSNWPTVNLLQPATGAPAVAFHGRSKLSRASMSWRNAMRWRMQGEGTPSPPVVKGARRSRRLMYSYEPCSQAYGLRRAQPHHLGRRHGLLAPYQWMVRCGERHVAMAATRCLSPRSAKKKPWSDRANTKDHERIRVMGWSAREHSAGGRRGVCRIPFEPVDAVSGGGKHVIELKAWTASLPPQPRPESTPPAASPPRPASAPGAVCNTVALPAPPALVPPPIVPPAPALPAPPRPASRAADRGVGRRSDPSEPTAAHPSVSEKSHRRSTARPSL